MKRIYKALDIEYDALTKQDWDNVLIVVGDEGCLTGDTLINVNRGGNGRKFRLDYIYKQFHNDYHDKTKVWDLNFPTMVRSFDGISIRLHKIKDVVFSGEKEVWKLLLKNGKFVEATKDHKIMTSRGWVELQKLNEDDLIMCDTLLPQKKNQLSFKLKDVALTTIYHPYCNVRNEVEVHRLIYESYLNNLNFNEFLDIVWNDEEKAKELSYIDPQKFHIHHKDGNHYNNDMKNLEVLDKKDHAFLHSKLNESFKHFNQGMPTYEKIEKIFFIGIKKTYDIICEEPFHNFVANGIVVHNSGKSTLLLHLLDYWCNKKYGACKPEHIKFINLDIGKWADSLSECKKGDINILDEGGDLSSRRTMSNLNLAVSRAYQIIRGDNINSILALPDLFWLDGFFTKRRARGFIKVFARGRFAFWSRDKLRKVIDLNSRRIIKNEFVVRPTFYDTFPKYDGILLKPYKEKKAEHMKDTRKELAETIKNIKGNKDGDDPLNNKIKELKDQGMQVAEIAREIGLSRQSVGRRFAQLVVGNDR